jgi:RecB family exonuclease
VVVIDLKTGKYPPTDKSLAENPQLGFYQHAVNHGAVDDRLGRPATSGGAELWQLRRESKGHLKVQSQPPQAPGEDGQLAIERQLSSAASALRQEEFEARPEPALCARCDFVSFCPAQSAGSVLS